MFFAGGDKYTGAWQDGKKEGEGELQYANGDVFTGAWHGDMASGHGVLSYASGNRYTGAWSDNKRHGTGMFECSQTQCRYARTPTVVRSVCVQCVWVVFSQA